MNYKENVRNIAEKMAVKWWAERAFKDEKKHIRDLTIKRMLPLARIAVRMQAEAVKSALLKHSDIKSKEETAYLVEQGLVPAPENNSFYCGGSQVTGNGTCTNQCGICAKIQRDSHDTANQ